jgi:hypothetical protein
MTLSYELIIYISSFCCNKESLYIAISSKTIYDLIKKKGFAKYISFDGSKNNDIFLFVKNALFHSKSLNTIYITKLIDAHIWLPLICWVDNVYLIDCLIKSNINLNGHVSTKFLKIVNSSKKHIEINFQMFPELEIFKYSGKLFNFGDNIYKYCTNIRKIELKKLYELS